MQHYKQLRAVGRGRFGDVVLVKDTRSDKEYVLKKVNVEILPPKERALAEAEVQLLARLKHPNIVGHRESFMDGENLCTVMQYCEGGDLSNYITRTRERKGFIPEWQVIDWLCQLLSALQYIHRCRIIHRDLKASNVFLTKNRVVRLGDFGISRVLENTADYAETMVGTPYYLSPEVCQNQPYTQKSDVWSLGCIVYELCTLSRAFGADNLMGLVFKIVREDYPPIPAHRYSKELREVVGQMLRKEPDQRPSIEQILRKPFIQQRISKFLEETSAGAIPRPVSSAGGGSAAPASSSSSSASSSRPLQQAAPKSSSSSSSSSQAKPRVGSAGSNRPVRPRGSPKSAGPAPSKVNTASATGRASPSLSSSTPKSNRERMLEQKLRRREAEREARMKELQSAMQDSFKARRQARERTRAEFQGSGGEIPPPSPSPTPSPKAPKMAFASPKGATDRPFPSGPPARGGIRRSPEPEVPEEEIETYEDDFEEESDDELEIEEIRAIQKNILRQRTPPARSVSTPEDQPLFSAHVDGNVYQARIQKLHNTAIDRLGRTLFHTVKNLFQERDKYDSDAQFRGTLNKLVNKQQLQDCYLVEELLHWESVQAGK